MANKKCQQCKKILDYSEYSLNTKKQLYSKCDYCREHIRKLIHVCQTCGCKAYYNYREQSIGIYCNSHKLPNMINIISPKCIVCKKKCPSFNNKGEKKATHCGGCSLTNMVDIKSPKCILCKKTQPTFNYEGEVKATHF